MIKKILVGVSGTPSLQAKIDAAVDLAKRNKASISVLSILDTQALRNVGPVPIGAQYHAGKLRNTRMEKSREKAEAAIAAFESACVKSNIPFEAIREEGDPIDMLSQVWRYHDLCLLNIKGWFDYDVIPEPEDALLKLVRKGVRPLLCVPNVARETKRVMIAYNGSIESAKTMKHYAQFNLWPDAKHTLVCMGATKTDENANDMLERAREYLAVHGIEAKPLHVTGKYDSPIHDFSKELGADLTVMGGSYKRVLLFEKFGKHAKKMIRDAECALFMSH